MMKDVIPKPSKKLEVKSKSKTFLEEVRSNKKELPNKDDTNNDRKRMKKHKWKEHSKIRIRKLDEFFNYAPP